MINAINSVTSNIKSNKQFTFKNDKKNIQEIIAKRNYIEAKTEELGNLGIISILLAILMGAHNIDFEKKITTSQKWGLAFGILSVTAFIAKMIQSVRLSSEYEKEQKNDSKNINGSNGDKQGNNS